MIFSFLLWLLEICSGCVLPTGRHLGDMILRMNTQSVHRLLFAFIYVFLLGILCSGCRVVRDHLLPVPVISVNPEFAVEASLEEACDSVFWISLQAPDSIVWASVEYAKSFGPYVVIPDIDRTMIYTVFDSVGNFVCQLNKRGKGPGEYIMDLQTFFGHKVKLH